MKALAVVWAILTFSSLLGAQAGRTDTLGEIKRWHLQIQHGEIDVTL